MKHIGLFISAVLVSQLVGCSSTPLPPPRLTVAPKALNSFDDFPDAEPKPEPVARYGNPDSYSVLGKRYRVLDNSHGYIEQGVASWYGPGFHNKLTSTREVYDQFAMTAAHKTLPLPTYAQVTNLKNHKHIIVRINDRGPFVDDRVIDLSYVAAGKLGLLESGTGQVEIRAIDPIEWANKRDRGEETFTVASDTPPVTTHPVASAPPPIIPVALPKPMTPHANPLPGGQGNQRPFYIQIGAFSTADRAQQVRDSLRLSSVNTRVQASGALHKVQVGPLASVEQAAEISRLLDQQGVRQTYYVSDDGALVRP